jgi:arginase
MAQKIRIIGVPMDLGASRRGVDMGPSALRVAGLQARIKHLGHQVEDIGNIPVKQPEEMSYGESMRNISAKLPRPARIWVKRWKNP